MSNTLILPFTDDSPSFTNGFEAGQIWTALQNGEEIDQRPCHAANEAMIQMICEHFEAEYCIEPVTDGWIVLTVKKKDYLLN